MDIRGSTITFPSLVGSELRSSPPLPSSSPLPLSPFAFAATHFPLPPFLSLLPPSLVLTCCWQASSCHDCSPCRLWWNEEWGSVEVSKRERGGEFKGRQDEGKGGGGTYSKGVWRKRTRRTEVLPGMVQLLHRQGRMPWWSAGLGEPAHYQAPCREHIHVDDQPDTGM